MLALANARVKKLSEQPFNFKLLITPATFIAIIAEMVFKSTKNGNEAKTMC